MTTGVGGWISRLAAVAAGIVLLAGCQSSMADKPTAGDKAMMDDKARAGEKMMDDQAMEKEKMTEKDKMMEEAERTADPDAMR